MFAKLAILAIFCQFHQISPFIVIDTTWVNIGDFGEILTKSSILAIFEKWKRSFQWFGLSTVVKFCLSFCGSVNYIFHEIVLPLNNFHSSTTGLRIAVAVHYIACPLKIFLHQRPKFLLILGLICRNSSTLPTDLFLFTGFIQLFSGAIVKWHQVLKKRLFSFKFAFLFI